MANYLKTLASLAFVLAWGGMAPAWSASLTQAQMKAAIQTDAVTIPTPGEFFAAVNKQGKPHWPDLIRKPVIQNSTNRAQLALNLGTLVADGYIAVEAQDGQQVKNVGKDIVNLAKALGVSQDILNRGNTINDFAENNDWSSLNEELEATENEVKLTMTRQKDGDLITLVTLGAWIRGVQAVSGIVVKNYTPASSQLLRQPAIIDYLLQQIGNLSSRLQQNPLIIRVRQDLQATQILVHTSPGEAVSETSAKEVYTKMSKLVDDISSRQEGVSAK